MSIRECRRLAEDGKGLKFLIITNDKAVLESMWIDPFMGVFTVPELAPGKAFHECDFKDSDLNCQPV